MTNRFMGFVAALVMWLAYFYVIDLSLMASQGIPVGWSLMPR